MLTALAHGYLCLPFPTSSDNIQTRPEMLIYLIQIEALVCPPSEK